MKVFFLHAQEPEVELLLPKLTVPHGTRLPGDSAEIAVVRWGAHAACPPELPQLNPLPNVLRAMHRKSLCEALGIHGMKTREPEDGRKAGAECFAHEFLVPVFHLAALAVFAKEQPGCWMTRIPRGPVPGTAAGGSKERTERMKPVERAERLDTARRPASAESGRFGRTAVPSAAAVATLSRKDSPQPFLAGFHELAPEVKSHHVRRATREAVKAVYALGLDYAVVRIGVTPDSRTVVTDVLPSPVLTVRLADLFAAAIAQYADDWQREETRRGPVVLGCDPEFVLQRWDGRIVAASRFVDRAGKVGCDAVVTRDGRTVLPLMELRPDPSPDPLVLVANLRQTMLAAARAVTEPHLTWLAGGMPAKGLPLGGHIHMSNVRLDSGLLRALDNYLALPLVLAEGEGARLRRKRYGLLGDFRIQPHGGFEYRSLPSWLSSPQLAAGVLCLAAVVARHYRELPQRPLGQSSIQRYYYAGDKLPLLPAVKALWRDLEATETYRRYKDELNGLKERVLGLAPWNEHEDFRLHWKIPPFAGSAGAADRFML